jgi:K+-sensing histidine kinase KdpD
LSREIGDDRYFRIYGRESPGMHRHSSPSARLIRSAKNIADSLHAKWFAVYVEDPKMLRLPDEKGKLRIAAGDPSSVLQQDILKEIHVARAAYDTGQRTGWGTETSSSTEILCVPLQALNSRLGILVLKPGDRERFLQPDQVQLLESLAKQIALALEVEILTVSGIPHCAW